MWYICIYIYIHLSMLNVFIVNTYFFSPSLCFKEWLRFEKKKNFWIWGRFHERKCSRGIQTEFRRSSWCWDIVWYNFNAAGSSNIFNTDKTKTKTWLLGVLYLYLSLFKGFVTRIFLKCKPIQFLFFSVQVSNIKHSPQNISETFANILLHFDH